jgi:hypothetical protein
MQAVHHPEAKSTMDNLTPLERRQAVFAALVQAQDEGKPVKTSRALVASQCNLSVQEVETIEREGLMRQWPPLG